MEASVDILVKVAQISVRGQASVNQAASPNPASSAAAASSVVTPVAAPQTFGTQQSASLAETRAAQNLAAKAAAGLNLNYQSEKTQNSASEESVFEEASGNGIPSLSLDAQQGVGAGAKRSSSPGLSLKK